MIAVAMHTPLSTLAVPALSALIAIGAHALPAQTLLRQWSGTPPFGRLVAGCGDIDGDGHDDIVVSSGGPIATAYSGQTGTAIHTLQLPVLNLVFTHNLMTLGRAGDVNGDGYDDILVTGSIVWLNPAPNNLADTYCAVWSGVDGTLALMIPELYEGSGFGVAAAAAGDVDNDGYDDIIIGDAIHNGTRGAAYLFSGQSGTLIHTHLGTIQGERLGTSVCGVGDIDGDGIDDVAVGSSGPSSIFGAGHVRAYSGQTANTLHQWAAPGPGHTVGQVVASVGDVDGDGTRDIAYDDKSSSASQVIVRSGSSGAVIMTLPIPPSQIHEPSAAGVGDANGDGHADVVIGNPRYSLAGAQECGIATLYSGATGLALATVTGTQPGEFLGCSVDGAGDVDRDGYRDWVVGASPLTGISPAGTATTYSLGLTGTPAWSHARGHGVSGSDGRLPRIKLEGRPGIGTPIELELRAALAGTMAWLVLGPPTAIPLPPTLIPNAVAYAYPFVIAATSPTNGDGIASGQFLIPNNASLAGGVVSTQWIAFDPVNNPLGMSLTGSMDLGLGF